MQYGREPKKKKLKSLKKSRATIIKHISSVTQMEALDQMDQ